MEKDKYDLGGLNSKDAAAFLRGLFILKIPHNKRNSRDTEAFSRYKKLRSQVERNKR